MHIKTVRRGLGPICLAAVGLSVLGLTGCGPDDGLVTVTGTITLDGQPVENGSISLMSVDGRGAGGDVITDGHYSARTAPGETAVQIYAHKTVKKQNPTPEEIERNLTEDQVQLLPSVYNRQSKLRIDITPDSHEFDFNLTSDGQVPEEMNVDNRPSANSAAGARPR